MQVNLYAGCFSLVKRSGVGQAFLHQKRVLERIGIQATSRWSEPAEAVHFNTVFPDSFMASLIARRQKKRSSITDILQWRIQKLFQYSNLLAPLFKRWIIRCYESAM
jgi:1,2-diacylglycerol-3-alpha-glucose alpha-1,2-glucosyltransferase